MSDKKIIEYNPLSDLFAFPAIETDVYSEYKKMKEKLEKREKFGSMPNDNDDEVIEPPETITGTVEYPYTLFVGISDKWLPDEDSLERAKKGRFDACAVTFASVGTFIVPWTREKFKEEFCKFVNEFENAKKEREAIIKSKQPPQPEQKIVPVMILQKGFGKEDGE